jgi:arylsulfatase A-like enzyme
MVEAVDDSVSQILATLKTQGFENNTLVIFSSDNGGLSTKPCTSNLPLRAGKGWAYEGGIRVPLIVRWPEHITANTTTDTPVTSMDFYPTLLTIAGLPLLPKQHLDGVSIAKLLNSNEPLARDTLYWHYPHYHGAGCSPVGALREGDLKLIHWFGADRYELYDLNDDPSELKDLSTSRIQDLSRLTGKLKRWQALFPKIKYNETNPFR